MMDRVYVLEGNAGSYDDYHEWREGIFTDINEAYAHLDDCLKEHRDRRDYYSSDTTLFVTTEKLGFRTKWTDEEILEDIHAHARAGDPSLQWLFDADGNFDYTINDPRYVGEPIWSRISKKVGKSEYRIGNRNYYCHEPGD